MQNIHQVLKQYWGFDTFRPLQEEIIHSVLQKKDTLALLPTGGGKSVCFQVPAMVTEGLCLVISPLIALMKDQVYNLNKKGIKAVAVYSGLSYRQIDTLLDSCVYGNNKFLYISPERLAMEDFQVRMEKMNISLLAIDEAHCISQWGYDFRPPYLKIAEVREKLKGFPLIALTATATPEVVEDIQAKLHFKTRNVFFKSFVRSNISYVVRQTANKNQSLLEILNKVNGSAILYVRNRRKTKEYSDYLNKHNIKSDFYHAGIEPNERSKKQENWIKNKTRIICCTNAFGMGIDKPDVRVVVHMDLADSIEAYFQEAGRAGRDEKKAYAVQLVDNNDVVELEKKITENFPSLEFIKDVYELLCVYCRLAYNDGLNQSFDFDIRDFSARNTLNSMKALNALKLLQQQELIYMTDSVYNLSQVKAVANKDVIYRFQTENKKYEPLIKFILRTSEGVFEDYVAIEEEVIASRLKISIDETIAQLKATDKFNIFKYDPRKEKPQIIFLQSRIKKEDLRLDAAFIKKRKESYEEKLKAVQFYVEEKDICRTKLLAKYFGENVKEDCGICDVCAAKKKQGLSTGEFTKIATRLENELRQSPLTLQQIKMKLDVEPSDLNRAIDFLMDQRKIIRTAESTLKWVE